MQTPLRESAFSAWTQTFAAWGHFSAAWNLLENLADDVNGEESNEEPPWAAPCSWSFFQTRPMQKVPQNWALELGWTLILTSGPFLLLQKFSRLWLPLLNLSSSFIFTSSLTLRNHSYESFPAIYFFSWLNDQVLHKNTSVFDFQPQTLIMYDTELQVTVYISSSHFILDWRLFQVCFLLKVIGSFFHNFSVVVTNRS